MRKIYLSALWMLLLINAGAQQLYFNHLSVNNGLTQGVNNCIFKDSKGFVWISSFDGLNRFDGMDCKKFYASPNEQTGIRGTLFLNILEDKFNDLWIGSNEGLNFYNRKTDSFYCYRIENLNNRQQFCSPFYIDDRNRIWVQSGFELFIFDPLVKKFTSLGSNTFNGNLTIKTFPQQQYKPLQKIFITGNGSPEFHTGDVSSDAVAWHSTMLPLQSVTINTMLLLGANDCLLGTSNGLYRLNPANSSLVFSKINPALQSNISSLHLDKTGVLWAGTFTEGVLKTDTAGNILQRYTSNADNGYSLSGNQVIFTYTDDNRNLWISVWGKGVDYTSLDKFHFNQYITKAEAAEFKTDNFLRSLTAVKDEVWCATQSGGIAVLDAYKKIKQVLRFSLPSSVEYLLADNDQVWAATFKGLFSINAITKQVTKMKFDQQPAANVASTQYNFISRLASGDLLLSSNAGLYIAKNEQGKLRLVTVKGINAADVYLTTYADATGQLYISKAFKGFGVYKLQGDSLIGIKQFPLQASIKSFTDTPDSLLWIGSTVGLIKFNKTTKELSRIFTTRDGLSNQYVYAAVKDGQYLWLSTNAGINRFDLSTFSIKNFSAADGLQSNEYNTYSFCKTASGEILFGGVNGLNGFYPANLTAFKMPPKLVLSSVHVNDSLYASAFNYSELNELQLDYEQNTIAFQFSVIDYVNAPAAHIAYMLEGYDRGWVNAANKSYIRYVNLPPGNYTLKVRAFNADDVPAEKIYTLLLIVQAPWWQQWWFRLLLTVVILSAVLLVIKTYLRRKLQKQRMLLEKELAVEQERIRMARELHDGLGSMLSGIKHSFSAIKNNLTLNNQQQDQFDYTIDKLDDSIKDLRAVSHTMFSAELLEQGLEAAIKNYCNAVTVTSRIKISFESIFQQPAGLSGEQAFHIFRVVQELVQNVIKHSKATEAIVQLSYDNKILAVTVEDNGIGFTIASLQGKTGIGLKNVESRIKMLHGKTDIQSKPGNGTSVFIEVPVR